MNKIVTFIISIFCAIIVYQPLLACDHSRHITKRGADLPAEDEQPLKKFAPQSLPESQQMMELEEQVDWKQLYLDAQQQIKQERSRTQELSIVITHLLENLMEMCNAQSSDVDFSGCGLTRLPWCNCEFNSRNCSSEVLYFGSMNFSNNNLEYLPECFGKHVIREIDLSNNELVRSPESFGGSFLEKLYLNSNNLESVPDCLIKYDKLHTLDLTGNRLIAKDNDIDLLFREEPKRIQCFLKFDRARKDIRKLFHIFRVLKECKPPLPMDVIVSTCLIIHNQNLKDIDAISMDDVDDYYFKAKGIKDAGDMPQTPRIS